MFNLSRSLSSQDIVLTIRDDQLLETDSEEFMISLELLTAFDGRIRVQPYLAMVVIKDNDSECI